MNVVITGASRGIGLELTRIALAAGHQLLAVAREPTESAGLCELLQRSEGRLEVIGADLEDPGAADAIVEAVSDWDAVDVLLNNAGVLRRTATREDFMASFLVNAIVPYELLQALLPGLRKSTNPRALHVTSKMGSIADNTSGGYYAYRASKAALNMINRSVAIDHDWLAAVVVHPGWVRTRMGGPEAPTSVEESARGIWQLVEGLKHGSSGRFFDYLGKELPY